MENEFLYKKAAVSYLKKEHLGFLGMNVPKEHFLQTKFDITNELASQVLGRLRVKHLISFSPDGILVGRDKINMEFGLFQRATPDPVTFNNMDDYKSGMSCQSINDRSRNDSGYSTSSSSNIRNEIALATDIHQEIDDSGFGDVSLATPLKIP